MSVPEAVLLESKPCPLGCPAADEIVLVGRDRLHDLPGEFTIVRCSGCGLMRTDPRPSPESIGFYYPDDYGPYMGTRVADASAQGADIPPVWKRALRSLLQVRSEHLPSGLSPGRMLEIGCASGSFMHRMAQEGWEVEGIEPSSAAGDTARRLGYPVYIGSLEMAPDPTREFDLVVGWMVLEHLHDPIGALQKLHKWSKPGAVLALSVPNAGAAEFRIFKNLWYALHLPNHLYHYTPKTVRAVLQRGGWRVERIHHQRTLANLMASMGYRRRDRGVTDKLTTALVSFPETPGRKPDYLFPVSYLLSLLGQTGRMTIWARRTDG